MQVKLELVSLVQTRYPVSIVPFLSLLSSWFLKALKVILGNSNTFRRSLWLAEQLCHRLGVSVGQPLPVFLKRIFHPGREVHGKSSGFHAPALAHGCSSIECKASFPQGPRDDWQWESHRQLCFPFFPHNCSQPTLPSVRAEELGTVLSYMKSDVSEEAILLLLGRRVGDIAS